MHLFQVDIKILKERLIVPDGFWETWEEKREGCNGCGTGWNQYLVPNTVYGLNIRIVCCIHDFGYEVGGTEEDRKLRDDEIHDNIEIVIDAYDKWYYPTNLAKKRADTYKIHNAASHPFRNGRGGRAAKWRNNRYR